MFGFSTALPREIVEADKYMKGTFAGLQGVEQAGSLFHRVYVATID